MSEFNEISLYLSLVVFVQVPGSGPNGTPRIIPQLRLSGLFSTDRTWPYSSHKKEVEAVLPCVYLTAAEIYLS